MADNQSISIAYMKTHTHTHTIIDNPIYSRVLFVEQHEAALAKVVWMHVVLYQGEERLCITMQTRH